jgi:hypothetical protein
MIKPSEPREHTICLGKWIKGEFVYSAFTVLAATHKQAVQVAKAQYKANSKERIFNI